MEATVWVYSLGSTHSCCLQLGVYTLVGGLHSGPLILDLGMRSLDWGSTIWRLRPGVYILGSTFLGSTICRLHSGGVHSGARATNSGSGIAHACPQGEFSRTLYSCLVVERKTQSQTMTQELIHSKCLKSHTLL